MSLAVSSLSGTFRLTAVLTSPSNTFLFSHEKETVSFCTFNHFCGTIYLLAVNSSFCI